MNGLKINQYEFSDTGKSMVSVEKKGKDWPVVYLIHNDNELYVGETQNIYKRFEQHLKNKDRKDLKLIKIIFDDEFNKSAALDIEQTLIQLFNADNKYKLQNLNGGQSEKHNYYQREKYLNKVDAIWDELTKKGMTNMTIDAVRNTDLFKYSPYNTLTNEQNEVCKLVLYDIMKKLSTNTEGTTIIRGSAGTGKTIVLINMIYKLLNANKFEIDFSDDDDSLTDNNQFIHDYKEFYNEYKKNNNKEIKIGYVVPMTSIRKTLKTVFTNTRNGFKGSLVIGPFDVFNDDYDIIFVDEAHRLAHYKNIGFRGPYKQCALKMCKQPEDVTQLDMIMARSKYRVIVYDENQTVKGSDITHEEFLRAFKDYNEPMYLNLTTQMRCKGGTDYIDYLSNIFYCKQDKLLELIDYDLKLFDDVDLMINKIKELDKKYGLCRNAAGYSWEWISKGHTYNEAIANHLEDIRIGNYRYVWNMTNEEFIISKNAINEIGCIHTLQGYDLNYVGVIFGDEIDYNPNTNRIEVDLDKFYDKYVKQGTDDETVRQYIINSYKVIMSRGIKGCYVYACNKNMRDYLARFVEKGE